MGFLSGLWLLIEKALASEEGQVPAELHKAKCFVEQTILLLGQPTTTMASFLRWIAHPNSQKKCR